MFEANLGYIRPHHKQTKQAFMARVIRREMSKPGSSEASVTGGMQALLDHKVD